MGFVQVKAALLLLQFSVVLLSCFNVLGNEFEAMSIIAQTPTNPPAEAPQHHKGHHRHPKHPPAHPLASPPPHPPPAPLPGHHPPVSPPAHHPPAPPPAHHPPARPPAHHPPAPPPAHQPPAPPPRHHPPAPPPRHHPPAPSPTLPPVHPPSHAPTPLPARKFVAVQGVVYCKSCKYSGIDTLLGATPLLGAVVRLKCNNTKYPLVQETKADKNGYFFIMAPKTVTTYGSHKCLVSLVSSPVATCNKPTNLHYGLKGAILMPFTKSPPAKNPPAFDLFTVGPFAFEPSSKVPCPR